MKLFAIRKAMNAWACAVMAIMTIWCGTTCAQSNTWTPMPTTTAWGTRGLSQTSSAEALGAGRLNVNLQGTWYRQQDAYPGTPNAGANIATGLGALAFGVSNHLDVFGSVNFFNSTKYSTSNKSGLGTVMGGLQASLPLPQGVPLFLGAQGTVLGGLSKNQINTNYTDGYNYFETRTNFDFMGKLLESLVFGNDGRGFALHLNEGAVKSTQAGKDLLLVLAGGIQGNIIPYLSVGVEGNSRTSFKNSAFTTDPVWVTPTVTIRTPAFLALTLGCDVAGSKKRSDDPAQRSLERYRLFGDLLFSIDCLAGKRRADFEKAKADSAERVQFQTCQTDVNRLAASRDSLTQRVESDSLAEVQCKRTSDSIAAVASVLLRKSQSDSMALILALAEGKRLLAIEKDRRSEIEKKLLSTGMLILDAVYFESGKAEISMNSKPYLQIIGKMLERYPKLELEVGGHTDNVGSPAKNLQLSQLRSEAVRDYLLQVAPGLMGRLSAMGYGSSVPKADNRKAAGRKINRRVRTQSA